MRNTVTLVVSFALIAGLSGCAAWGPGTSQTDPNDPVGSASIGTGSVTSGSTIPREAWSSGIGLAP